MSGGPHMTMEQVHLWLTGTREYRAKFEPEYSTMSCKSVRKPATTMRDGSPCITILQLQALCLHMQNRRVWV